MIKFYKLLFFYMLMIGTLISISSYSWMGIWVGLEINLLSIIPLMNSTKNTLSSEASIKYFITQAIASTILLFTIIMMSNQLIIIKNIDNTLIIIFNSSLLTKMGAAPFHFWFPEVMEGLNWTNCLILLTWQKIAPMVIIMYNMNFSMFFSMIIMFCMLISGIMGLNQVSLRKILAYSSINHIAWMLSSMFFMETLWLYYFLIYSLISFNIIIMFKILNVYYMKQLFNSLNKNIMIKFFFIMNFLSLGGLPPFIGFLPKWLTIQLLINNNFYLLSFSMILMTLLTLFYYMRMTFSTFLLSMNENNYNLNLKMNYYWIIFFNFLSLMSLMLLTIMFNFI